MQQIKNFPCELVWISVIVLGTITHTAYAQPSNTNYSIENIAYAGYQFVESSSTAHVQLSSNAVYVTVEQPIIVVPEKASIQFTTADFQQTLYRSKLSDALHIQAMAAQCNQDPNHLEQLRLNIVSKLTGDVVEVIAKENAHNSGIFEFSLDVDENTQANLSDLLLQTLKRDQVSVSASACVSATGQTTTTLQDVRSQILIEPYSIVFDAKTQQPIAGARVVILDEHNQPISAIHNTGKTNDQVTNALGEFYYPNLQPGQYKLQVDTSTIVGQNYQFASNPERYPLSSFTQYQVDPVSAYGGLFSINTLTVPTDIPLDPINSVSNLIVEKTVRNPTVEVGDFSHYDITITNKSAETLQDIELTDQLPYGFHYVLKSLKLNGQTINDPLGASSSNLRLPIGALTSQQSAKIEYRVLIGQSALNGDGINRARAVDLTHQIRSNEAQAKVNVRPGVFTSEGFIVGKVFTDCNRNGLQDTHEAGVAGVRIYLEDGSYVMTDREGKYDFYGISAKTHVLKLDQITLPATAELVLLSNRQAGDAGSRFVDLKRGEIHRADFAIADQAEQCSAPLLADVEQRKQISVSSQLNLEKAINQQLSIDAPQYLSRSRRLEQAAGCLTPDNGQNCLPLTQPKLPQPTFTKMAQGLTLEQHLQSQNNASLAFLNLHDQQVLLSTQTNIQLQGLLGATQRLWINGKLIDDSRRAKLSTLAEQNKQGLEYIGLELQAGANDLKIEQLDFAGNVRESQQINIIAPDVIDHLHVMPLQHTVMANGRDRMQIRIQLLDKHGVKVGTRSSIRLENDIGLIQLPDLNPNEPGIQQFIEGGELIVDILSPTTPATGTLQVSSGLLQQQQSLNFVADLRPLIAVGLIEGTLNFNAFNLQSMQKTQALDGFEEQLNEIAAWDKQQLTGRAALFLKGKVRGDYLLTLAYDSNKNSNTRLFRDIQPDEYYPIYGDAASKGFDAQSTSKLYVRLDKGRHYAMYGDYVTRTEQDEGLALGQYNRSLTGLKLGYQNEQFSSHSFAARTQSRQITREHRAFGLTGPYSLNGIANDLILDNSEKVEIITRDRNNTGLIIERQLLTRFVDYEIDPYSQSIYLKQAVSSVDADFNPRFVRITVEADEIGAEYYVAGTSFNYAVNPTFKIGGSWVENHDPLHPQQLTSLNSIVQLGSNTKLVAEVAQSVDQDKTLNQNSIAAQQQGLATRVELEYKTQAATLRAYHHQAEPEFYNDAAIITAGQSESGIKAALPVKNLGLVRIEAIRSEDQNNDAVKQGMMASVEHQFSPSLSLEAGLRHYDENTTQNSTTTDSYNGTTARIKANARLPWRAASTFLEYEQDLQQQDRQVVALGGTATVLPQTEIYARHEIISSLDGLYALNSQSKTNSTLFGISSNYMKDASVFSEYRVADSMSQREAEAAVGLRNRWQLQPSVYLSSSFERTQHLGDQQQNTDSTALSVALEYLPHQDWKATTRLEARYADEQHDFLHAMAYAKQLKPELSLLVKNSFNFTDSQSTSQGDLLRNRAQVGLAWRDQSRNRFDLLGKLEHYYEHNQQDVLAPIQRQSYISSIHSNYHPTRYLTLSGQYAAKWSSYQQDELKSEALTQLLRGRMIYDINERWDFGVQIGTLWDQHTTQYLLGAEVGYLVATNLWVSAGYNTLGYQEQDLAAQNSDAHGAYLKFRFKFDEQLFAGRNPTLNPALEPKRGH